jgi:hypothetical protein
MSVAEPEPAMPLFTQPWGADDGDPSDPDLVAGSLVVDRLQIRDDTGGALVALEDGRYAVTGMSVAVGRAEVLARYARRRAAGAGTNAEHRWWTNVAAALPR